MGVQGPIHLDIDITGKLEIEGPLHTQVTVHLPNDRVPSPPVFFAFPGGGAGRGMYCMEAPTTLSYS